MARIEIEIHGKKHRCSVDSVRIENGKLEVQYGYQYQKGPYLSVLLTASPRLGVKEKKYPARLKIDFQTLRQMVEVLTSELDECYHFLEEKKLWGGKEQAKEERAKRRQELLAKRKQFQERAQTPTKSATAPTA
jgi:hypothetical protein